jgi:hypothetical protein
MKKRLTLPAAFLAALASSTYADDKCFDYEKSLPDVPTKHKANEAQLGAITEFETTQNILWPLNQVV